MGVGGPCLEVERPLTADARQPTWPKGAMAASCCTPYKDADF